MSFGGIVGVFENQEVHVAFSFASGAAIFHREPPATFLECKNVDGYGGVEFFEWENSTPRALESVRNLCNLSNYVDCEWVDIAPTTRSKRSIFSSLFWTFIKQRLFAKKFGVGTNVEPCSGRYGYIDKTNRLTRSMLKFDPRLFHCSTLWSRLACKLSMP